MPIIKFNKNLKNPDDSLLYLYPDPLATQKEKESDDYIKGTMDYFYTIAINRYSALKQEVQDNYDLVKGILKRTDFYNDPEVKSFTEVLLKNEDLPAYVKHYSILTPPINTLVGELTKRPDNIYVKAFDEDSQAEELQFKTELLQQYIIENAKSRISAKFAQQGEEVDEEELQQATMEQVQEQLSTYTSQAEKWGATIIDYLKVRLSLKEKSEEAFRDLLIAGREYYHIYEDNSPIGFNIEVLNPRNTWFLNTPDKKYISDPLDPSTSAYAAGTICVMELSEIIQKFTLTEEEIKHLRDLPQESKLLSTRESNLVNPSVKGEMSITYNTYNPLYLEERMIAESEMIGDNNSHDLSNFLGITNNVGTFGYKYIVTIAYHCAKKKVGKLTFVDEDNQEQTLLVDENYKEGSHPQELSIDWTWVNQWYKGLKIGPDIYYYEPFELLDYCPIIGLLYENKNSPIRSLVDQMKPFQMLYNVAMNQLFRLLEKDMGVVFLMSARHVPIPKDGDHQDAIEVWETEAKEKGMVWIDDSPENLKVPSGFNQFSAINLSRAQEIQARYNLAVEMRNECWKLVGLSEQRLGESKATETATGINTALTQSYAQTEPWFTAHYYTFNKLLQATLDAAIYIESSKPTSTISYITSEGEHAFSQMNGTDLKMKDLGVLITDRAEDAKNFNEMRSLAQAMLQNGASPYEISLLYSTKSFRYMKEVFKKLRDTADDFQRRQQSLEEQQLQQQGQQAQQQMQLLQLQQEKQQAYEAYQADLDRASKERIAYINASSKNSNGTVNTSTLDLSRFDHDISKANQDYSIKLQQLQAQQQQILMQQYGMNEDRKIQKEKLQVERYKADTALQIARENKNASEMKKKQTKKK